jgi:VanZ like family.
MILLGLPGSCFPRAKPVFGFVGIDKAVHFILFMAFSFISIWGFRKQYLQYDCVYRKKAIIITFSASVLFGGLSEILQEYVFVGREGSCMDYFCDIAGASIGLSFFLLLYSKNTKNGI